jgi:hypothetical protein
MTRFFAYGVTPPAQHGPVARVFLSAGGALPGLFRNGGPAAQE